MSKFIVDDIGAVVCKMNKTIAKYGPKKTKPANEVFYLFGHRTDVNAQLAKKKKDRVSEYQMFPLVILNMDIPEEVADGMKHYNLNVLIVAETQPEYSAAERYTHVYKPVLVPLYDLFIESLRKVSIFTWKGDLKNPPHIKLDRPYWGSAGAEGNTAKKFDATLDAIELVQLNISQDLNYCK